MTKQHFIALAETLRNLQPDMGIIAPLSTPQAHAEKRGQQEQWLKTVDALASFCKSQNSNFNRERWIGYINNENGPSGGKVKAAR